MLEAAHQMMLPPSVVLRTQREERGQYGCWAQFTFEKIDGKQILICLREEDLTPAHLENVGAFLTLWAED